LKGYNSQILCVSTYALPNGEEPQTQPNTLKMTLPSTSRICTSPPENFNSNFVGCRAADI
jgi:hypothetical protein